MPYEILARINWRRAWVLITALWIVAVATWSYGAVLADYDDSIPAKIERDERKRDYKFLNCLAKNRLDWESLKAAHEVQCKKLVAELPWCNGRWSCDGANWLDHCIRNEAKPCREFAERVGIESWPGEGDGSPKIGGLSYEQDRHLKRILFYVDSGYSKSLMTALWIALLPPLLLLFIPPVFRRLWNWLTGRPRM